MSIIAPIITYIVLIWWLAWKVDYIEKRKNVMRGMKAELERELSDMLPLSYNEKDFNRVYDKLNDVFGGWVTDGIIKPKE